MPTADNLKGALDQMLHCIGILSNTTDQIQEQIDNITSDIEALKEGGTGQCSGEDTPATYELGVITHKLGRYPVCNLYETSYAMGIKGIGEGPAGGNSLQQVQAKFELIEHDKVRVYTTERLSIYTGIAYLKNNKVAFFNPDDPEDVISLILTLY